MYAVVVMSSYVRKNCSTVIGDAYTYGSAARNGGKYWE